MSMKFATVAFCTMAVSVSALKLTRHKEQRACPTRVWSLCEGQQIEAPTEAQQEVGVKSAANMQCSNEMSFKELCCFDFENFDTHLTEERIMMLDAAQISSSAHAFFQNDEATNKTAPISLVCTSAVPTPKGNSNAAEIRVECFTHELSAAAIKGPHTVEDGNPILNLRIDYLVKAGVPAVNVPMCFQEVGPKCPNNRDIPLPGAKYVQSKTGCGNGSALTQTTNEDEFHETKGWTITGSISAGVAVVGSAGVDAARALGWGNTR